MHNDNCSDQLNQLVLASHNSGKLKEFQQLFAGTAISVQSARDFNLPDVEETAVTFVENALIKARHVTALTGLPALADDSGLSVNFLNGQPGVFSARFSESGTDEANNQKLLTLMKNAGHDERQASFHCVLVLVRHENDPTPLIAQGQWQGRLLTEARGNNGFGYDPLFWVESEQASSAELPPETKNRISPRARALQKLLHLMAKND